MSQGFPRQVCVVGLGYVGLQLAVHFARHVPIVGFDVDRARVAELQSGYDRNGEVPQGALEAARIRFTSDAAVLRRADLILIAVPTPVVAGRVDLSHLVEASRLVGRHLQRGSVVVYESTVYPGCTEEVCIPVLEEESGLRAGVDFKVGYSPERINPGDREHGLEGVVKVIAGQDTETVELLARAYSLVAKAGVHRAPSIRVAEAAKVVENVQRDVNVALVNELAMLFHAMGVDTRQVLAAARTKWNFLSVEPGLVGGRCIPAAAYYLAHKAQEFACRPEIMLAARMVNDRVSRHVAEQVLTLLRQAGTRPGEARVLVLGTSYKEDVRDVRNSGALQVVRELQSRGCRVEVHDPHTQSTEKGGSGCVFVPDPFEDGRERYDAVVLAVPHREFRQRNWSDYVSLFSRVKPGVFVDVKGVFAREAAQAGGNPHKVIYWTL
jgi:UDP-N-acetyl-D-galactosamine dehydrogenase